VRSTDGGLDPVPHIPEGSYIILLVSWFIR